MAGHTPFLCAVLSQSLCAMQFTGRVNDVRWHCQNGTYNVPTGNAGLLDIIMMDTNPFMPHYQNEAWSKNAGASELMCLDKQEQ
jgi:hypothetical protein